MKAMTLGVTRFTGRRQGSPFRREAALPEALRRGVAAGPEVADSAGDRAVVLGRHGPSSCSVREHARGRHSFSLGLPPGLPPASDAAPRTEGGGAFRPARVDGTRSTVDWGRHLRGRSRLAGITDQDEGRPVVGVRVGAVLRRRGRGPRPRRLKAGGLNAATRRGARPRKVPRRPPPPSGPAATLGLVQGLGLGHRLLQAGPLAQQVPVEPGPSTAPWPRRRPSTGSAPGSAPP